MKKTIKRQWAFLSLAVLGMLASAPSSYADGFIAGKVETVRVHDATSGPWAPPAFWFLLAGVNSAGSCPISAGRVLFVANNKEMLAFAMTAHLTDKTVQVYYSDTSRLNGLCRAWAFTAGTPPPGF